MKISGVIFDLDGTLARTNTLIFDSFRFIFKKYLNSDKTDDDIIALFGPTEEEILKKVLPLHQYDIAINEFCTFYKTNHQRLASSYEGIEEGLDFLKTKNIPLGIYTGKGRITAKITLTELGLSDYFSLIVSGSDVKNSKPSPEGIKMFIEKFDLKGSEVVLVGDSVVDIKTADNAGIKCLSVIWDSYGKNEVRKLNSEFCFDRVEDLFSYIKKHTRKNL